jgi:hypothetical protein
MGISVGPGSFFIVDFTVDFERATAARAGGSGVNGNEGGDDIS